MRGEMGMKVREWFDDIQAEPWNAVRPAEVIGGLGFCFLIAWFSHSGERWVPIIDMTNLLFHEAGHPAFGVISENLEVYGGTFGQLVFPIATLISFWIQRKLSSFYVACVWLVENVWNISRYMADARARLLPLFGAGDRLHDWEEILGRWNKLDHDVYFANRLRAIAWIAITVLTLWFLYRAWSSRDGTSGDARL
jgi:hypothetical protein